MFPHRVHKFSNILQHFENNFTGQKYQHFARIILQNFSIQKANSELWRTAPIMGFTNCKRYLKLNMILGFSQKNKKKHPLCSQFFLEGLWTCMYIWRTKVLWLAEDQPWLDCQMLAQIHQPFYFVGNGHIHDMTLSCSFIILFCFIIIKT